MSFLVKPDNNLKSYNLCNGKEIKYYKMTSWCSPNVDERPLTSNTSDPNFKIIKCGHSGSGTTIDQNNVSFINITNEVSTGWKAFDGNRASSAYGAVYSQNAHYVYTVIIELLEPVIITYATFTSNAKGNNHHNESYNCEWFYIFGSNDNSSWTNIAKKETFNSPYSSTTSGDTITPFTYAPYKYIACSTSNANDVHSINNDDLKTNEITLKGYKVKEVQTEEESTLKSYKYKTLSFLKDNKYY